MNTLNVSSSAAPFYLSSPHNHHWSVSVDTAAMSSASPWARAELTVQYDERGRLRPFVETAEQRRARLAFLRKGKLSKRISEWLEDASLDSEAFSDQRSLRTPSRRSSSSSLRTIDEEDESEPEIIYATAPPSHWTLPPTLLPATRPTIHHARTNSFSSLNSSRTSSSLSIISEED